MSDRNKNITSIGDEFLRYRRNEMTGEERNAFEKKLQKDPFAEEAMEGYETISADELAQDLNILGKKMELRLRSKKRFIYYRVAASIAVLMVISSIFIVINRENKGKHLRGLSQLTEPVDIIRLQPIKEPVIVRDRTEAITYPSESIDGSHQNPEKAKKAEQIPVNDEIMAAADMNDKKTESDILPGEKDIISEQITVPSTPLSRARSSSGYQARGKIISSEDNLPLQGASISIKGTRSGVMTDTAGNFRITLPDSEKKILVADFIGMETKEFEATTDSQQQIKLEPVMAPPDEVVIVGYGKERSVLKKEINYSSYNPPQPLTGKEAFNKYILENIQRPDTATAGQRVVVVLSFLVRADGSLNSIKIIRSPHEKFSNEAIRLLESGPSWKPAEVDGDKIEDEVTLRIVFR